MLSQETNHPRLRIVHVQLLPILSGVQRVSLEEFAALDQQVFEPHLICQSPGEFTEEAAAVGVQCHFAENLQRPIDPRQDYRAYRQILDLLRQIDPVIVHTHSSKTGLLGRWAASHLGVDAIVHTVHGFAFPSAKNAIKRKCYQVCERMAAQKCHAIICLNHADEETTKTILGASPETVFRIANGIQLDRFDTISSPETRKRLKRELLSLDDRPLVLQVGRLWEQKNPELFIRAACRLVQEGLDCHFALAGDGPLKEKLAGIIEQSGVTEKVHLLGWRADVPQILPLADAFVLSSNWEGMPLVLLEANACGVPAIATNVPGSRDCILDGTTGFLARQNDCDDLAERIRVMMTDADMRKKMAERALRHVHEHHDIRDRHRAMLDLYAELLRRGNRPRLAELALGSQLADVKPSV